MASNRLRDQMLRRADWRFLLDDPNLGASLCGSNALLRDAVAMVSGSVADLRSSASTNCDLFAAIDPTTDALRHGFERLRPGASCYTEWSVRGRNSTRPRQMLAAAGFEQIEFYCPWPSVDHPRVWFPLDEPALSTAYFTHQIAQSGGVLRRLVRNARRLSYGMSKSRLLPSRVAAIARKPLGPAQRDQRAASIIATVTEHWAEWDLGPVPTRLRAVMHTGGPRAVSKVVTYVHADAETQPRVVIKAARVPAAAIGLLRESSTLAALHDRFPGACDGVPRVLLSRRIGGLSMVCESAVEGMPITPRMVFAKYGDIAEAGTRWLIRFAKATCDPASHESRRVVVENAVNEFARTYGAVAAGWVTPARITDVLETVSGPSVCEHRDFSPWNVLVDPIGRLSVVDWESSELKGVAGPDAVYFLTYLAFYRDRLLGARSSRAGIADFVHSYRRNWSMSSETGRINNACFTSYCQALGVDPASGPPVRMLTWLIHSKSDYRRLADDAGTIPSTKALRRALFLNLLQIECENSMAAATAA